MGATTAKRKSLSIMVTTSSVRSLVTEIAKSNNDDCDFSLGVDVHDDLTELFPDESGVIRCALISKYDWSQCYTKLVLFNEFGGECTCGIITCGTTGFYQLDCTDIEDVVLYGWFELYETSFEFRDEDDDVCVPCLYNLSKRLNFFIDSVWIRCGDYLKDVGLTFIFGCCLSVEFETMGLIPDTTVLTYDWKSFISDDYEGNEYRS
ncbi:MAG: hypothetical protein EZS28_003730 [Streblomastix strix]|uniref:Uncharacterized protein n=1 Tax=Streblomastix strix TaxID=222440 RepID=A0A5J4X056_9EUKA|nr:MAG: hypothetical protein EZS28_003730 [Streblomastix strix]